MIMSTNKNVRSRMMMSIGRSEIAIYRGNEEAVKISLSLLASKRPNLTIEYDESKRDKIDSITWSLHSDKLQVDCTLLEPLFLGNQRLTTEATAALWYASG
jgi:hypothetical protein